MKKSYISRKDSIVLSAVEIIDELGIHALSIRELAKRQGVTEPAIYRHFTNKQEILLAVLDYYSNYDKFIAATIQEREFSAKEALVFVVKSYMEYYENDPPLTAITVSYDFLQSDAAMGAKLKGILESRYRLIFGIVDEGKKKGELMGSYEAEDLTHLILGATTFMAHRWRLGHYNFPLKEETLKTVKSLLKMC